MNMRTPERVLSVSGYTKKAWRTATRAHPRNNSSSTQPSEKVRKGSVTIPYAGQATEGIARLFHDRGMTTHIRPYNTIRAIMVRLKDKILMEEQCGVVYQITRSQAAYVGETGTLSDHTRERWAVCEYPKGLGHHASGCEFKLETPPRPTTDYLGE